MFVFGSNTKYNSRNSKVFSGSQLDINVLNNNNNIHPISFPGSRIWREFADGSGNCSPMFFVLLLKETANVMNQYMGKGQHLLFDLLCLNFLGSFLILFLMFTKVHVFSEINKRKFLPKKARCLAVNWIMSPPELWTLTTSEDKDPLIQPQSRSGWCSTLTLLLICSSFIREMITHYWFAHY